MTAYSGLFKAQLGNPASGLRFVAINTDPATKRKAVIDKLMENSWPWANVMASDAASGAGRFADMEINPKKPMLAICSADGTVTYAGPAAGFLTPMVLEGLTGLDAAEMAEMSGQMENAMNKAFEQVAETMNHQMPNMDGQMQVQPAGQDDELTPESYQAQKMLANAENFINLGKFTTYKKGIDMARNVISQFPDTSYADEARQLMRKVPERYRKRYNVTNEEMGL